MSSTTAVISLLHETDPLRNSAVRKFRDRPVLAWTLARLARCAQVNQVTVICWEDQQDSVRAVAGQSRVIAKPKSQLTSIDRISAAQRWSDGWRGGLQGTCHCDRGFHAPFVLQAVGQHSIATDDLILLIDPASALVDPALIDGLIEHAIAHPHREFFFTQAAPGLAGVVLRPALLERLAKANTHPGRLLAYSPDTPGLDPITNDMCFAAPAAVTRTLHRFALDSDRQIRRIAQATSNLNGQLMATSAEDLSAILNSNPSADSQPREIVLELTTHRATRPIYSPVTHLNFDRGQMPLDFISGLLAQVARIDDLRITLAGVGDPLLHPQFAEVLKLIHEARIPAVHIETDLVELPEAILTALAKWPVDVLTVHLPAATAATYQRVMGIDALPRVLENLKRLLAIRLPLPLIVPTFSKCRENLEEMEPWYDHWLRIVGTAVIVGPSDFAGQIADHAAADMAPPRRTPCARLKSRMTVQSDGTIASCEEDVLARQPMGNITGNGVATTWRHSLQQLRNDHESGQWESRPLCAACREWDRP